MDTVTETSITRIVEIAAAPETVWEFLVDPDKLMRWKGVTADLEPNVGGDYRITVIPSHVASGNYVEIDRPRRLVMTWGWEESGEAPAAVPPGSSTIVFELEPHGDGTTLTFTHRDLPGVESVQSHTQGWDHYLGRLSVAASGGDPGPDPWLERS